MMKKNIALRLIFTLFVCAVALMFNIVAMAGEQPQEVTDKVAEIIEDCGETGLSEEYDIAVWLHDWLTENANYDYTYSNYTPAGVLLYGTGVCQSYAEAYELLLNAVGIENTVLYAPEMNHAWNLVRLDGEWCHVDCTWDDPGEGGNENHAYFGLNDALIARDHEWNTSAYPAATSTQNLYLIRMDMNVFSNLTEMGELLDELSEAKISPFDIHYIGTDNDFDIMLEVQKWIPENNYKYGIIGYSMSRSGYSIKLNLTYGEPWEKPEPLAQPVQGSAFTLTGPGGTYSSSDFADNGIIMIFGQTGCGNTGALLDYLKDKTDELNEKGIKVIVNWLSCDEVSQLAGSEIVTAYPGAIFTCYNQNLLVSNLTAVGAGLNNLFTPIVFVYGNDNMITYYSIGRVMDNDALFDIACDSVPDSEPTPDPEPNPGVVYGDVDGDGSVTNIDSAIVARSLAGWTGYEATNPDYDFTVADVDRDGFLTNIDSAIIARHLAGWTGYETLPKQ